MLSLSNRFAVLEELDQFDDELEHKSNDKIIGQLKTDISLEFVNSKPIRIKRFKKNVNHTLKSTRVNKKQCAKNEIDDLPCSIIEAVELKKNLTLKQILVLMNLQGIPGFVLNTIHDKLQKNFRRKQVKIFHVSRIFYVSQYNWYDLVQIETMINEMLDS